MIDIKRLEKDCGEITCEVVCKTNLRGRPTLTITPLAVHQTSWGEPQLVFWDYECKAVCVMLVNYIEHVDPVGPCTVPMREVFKGVLPSKARLLGEEKTASKLINEEALLDSFWRFR